MRIRLPAHACIRNDYVVLKEVNRAGKELIDRLFKKKAEWEQRNNREFFLDIVLDLPYQNRTFKQNASVWVLVTAIFESMEGRLPDEEEKYGLYLDLVEEYADKVPSKLGGLRPVHISESNSLEGARFIDGLIYHLAKWCELSGEAQSSVIGILREWHEWRGGLAIDPVDYADLACTRLLTETEWRERHPISEASGRGGAIERAHIVSRGADTADIEKSWNWLALTHDEHMEQHRLGWGTFLCVYPHLQGRVTRARQLARKSELAVKSGYTNTAPVTESLAMEALGI